MFKEISVIEYINLGLNKYYYINNNPYMRCVIYERENCEAFIVYSLIFDRIEIDYIYVIKEYRSQNIGTKLIKYVENVGYINECKNISLEVSIQNINAINLYYKCGFINVAKRERYYNGIDGILMLKKLGD